MFDFYIFEQSKVKKQKDKKNNVSYYGHFIHGF
jgi:hypothetical protein